MSESRHVLDRRNRILGGIGVVILAIAAQAQPLAAADNAPPLGPAELDSCREARIMRPAVEPAIVPSGAPLEAVLDEDGVVVAHDLRLADLRLRLGPRALGFEAGEDRIVLGERQAGATSLWLLNTRRGCIVWERNLSGLIYDVGLDDARADLLLSAVQPGSRRYLGRVRMSLDTGVTTAMLEGTCLTPCEPNDGEVPDGVFIPAAAPRPVPFFGAGGWPKGTTLAFDWVASARPPDWAREPIITAADDATTSSRSASPTFVFRATAPERVRYTPTFPDFCRMGIACAWRNMPVSWNIYVRPQGTDFPWGTLHRQVTRRGVRHSPT